MHIPESEQHMDAHEDSWSVPSQALATSANGSHELVPYPASDSSPSSAECNCPGDCIRDHETD